LPFEPKTCIPCKIRISGFRSISFTGIGLKFGSLGQTLLPKIEQIEDLRKLSAILEAIETANTVEELRHIAPGRMTEVELTALPAA